MHHAEIRYSSDMDLEPTQILARIEAIIQGKDPGSGACKGRAYRADAAHHRHILVEVSLLDKPHRDDAFMSDLCAQLETEIKSHLSGDYAFSLALTFSPKVYVTYGVRAD